MTAWTDACPICGRRISAHSEQVAAAHYQRWLRAASYGPLYWDERPSFAGEFDGLRIVHKAGR